MFTFKQFSVQQLPGVFKIGTDALILGAAANPAQPKRILEPGTGSGIVSLMLGQRFPNARITACDIDPAAVQAAAGNFERSPFRDRITVAEADFIEQSIQGSYDAVVCNPPYFTSGPEREAGAAARHEHSFTLSGFMNKSAKLLTPEGTLHVILPTVRLDECTATAGEIGLNVLRTVYIRYDKRAEFKRVLVELGKQEKPPVREELCLRNTDGSFSTSYKELTADFHPFL